MFGRDKCKKLIKYSDRGIEFTFGSKIDSFVPFVKIKVDTKKLEESCEVAKTLDYHLYGLCELHKDLDHDSSRYREYLKKHERILGLMSTFRLALTVPGDNSKNQEKIIADSINDIRDFLREEKIISHIDEHDDTIHLKNKMMQTETKLKKYRIGFVISIASLLIIAPIIYFGMQQDYEQKIQATIEEHQLFLLEKQTDIVISIISHNLQTLHDGSKLIEVILINEYESSGETVPEFINKIDNDENFVIYDENFNYPHVSAYHHLMKSGPNCEFVQYAYEDKMLRPNGSSLESCTKMNKFDLFLSSILPSTGTNDFVMGLARTINFDSNDETAFDLIATIAIDLTKFSQDIQNSIDSDNMRFVLVDRSKYIVFDCDNQNCYADYEKHALKLSDSAEGFNKDSQAKKYDETVYSDYDEHAVIEFSKNNDGLHVDNNNDSEILIGFKLYVFYK